MADEKHYRREIAAPKSGSTVVVETGLIVPDANSYIDVAYADDYHLATVYSDAWQATLPNVKAQAVINATRLIDANFTFNGYIVSSDQCLKWPRQQAENPEIAPYPYGYPQGYVSGMGSYTFYPMNEIPKCLKDATAQQAMEIMRVGSDPTAVDLPPFGIQAITVADISLTYKSGSESSSSGARGVSPISTVVQRLLLPIGSLVSSSFGSVPVVRVA